MIDLDKVIEFICLSTVLATPVLIIDMWLKQEKVNDRLNEIQESVNDIQESVNELNEDDSD